MQICVLVSGSELRAVGTPRQSPDSGKAGKEEVIVRYLITKPRQLKLHCSALVTFNFNTGIVPLNSMVVHRKRVVTILTSSTFQFYIKIIALLQDQHFTELCKLTLYRLVIIKIKNFLLRVTISCPLTGKRGYRLLP